MKLTAKERFHAACTVAAGIAGDISGHTQGNPTNQGAHALAIIDYLADQIVDDRPPVETELLNAAKEVRTQIVQVQPWTGAEAVRRLDAAIARAEGCQ